MRYIFRASDKKWYIEKRPAQGMACGCACCQTVAGNYIGPFDTHADAVAHEEKL